MLPVNTAPSLGQDKLGANPTSSTPAILTLALASKYGALTLPVNVALVAVFA